jgi:hypothetical protein
MLRVLAHAALADAVLHGGERLAFHGYRLEGRRLTAAGADRACVELTLVGCGGVELLDRVCIAVAFPPDAGSGCHIELLHAPATAARRTESLAGCVSPIDARYASPETGQIS